ncbi:hypothetical protein NP233_g3661 [Leucocoprinus birnbaumii]|uniref:J domain-containing protein n=1 Tax=Leucocoprinus birnbaumii TaxID=56174 RepID=A0AAD5VW50_9AGAR|nr:hypothetical protein NP233_g3661 [Leucocoprinus birnbaumii]
MSQFPDYYKLLNIPSNSSQEEVRQAYRRESLKTHPDRLANATPAEKQAATERFQAVADAYYVLSDPQRRKEYDTLYSTRSDRTDNPNSTYDFFAQFANLFGGGAPQSAGEGDAQPNADGVFADVFEELLRPEVERRVPIWGWVGAACGGGIGFIVANVPGLMLGAFAGNRLGAVRDAKGKSVAAVFSELSGNQRAELLGCAFGSQAIEDDITTNLRLGHFNWISVLGCGLLAMEGSERAVTQNSNGFTRLKDRVLVTPNKKHNRSHFRIHMSRARPNAPSRPLRHSTQRTTSFSFAPYPKTKRNPISHSVEKTPPRTPTHRLRRTLSERSYFTGLVETSSETQACLTQNRIASPSKGILNRARRLSRSDGPPLKDIKPQNSKLNSSACFLGSANVPFELGNAMVGDTGLSLDSATGTHSELKGTDVAEGMGLELEFQSLRLEGQRVADIKLGDCSWPTPYEFSAGIENVNEPAPMIGSPCLPESKQRNEDLILRLRRALATETHARQHAERQHLQEMKRRIEMEEIVAQLQCEREELSQQLSAAQPPPSSSPVLLSSSPCTSSKVLIAPTLLGHR